MLGSEITKYFSERPDLKPHYLGWTCVDKLPDNLPLRKYLALNTCTSDKPGEHWVAVGRYSDDIVEIFNSLGNNPNLILLLSSKYKGEIHFNENNLQPLSSDKCGFYVITFIEERLKNFDLSMDEILEETFSSNSNLNDELVLSYLAENN